MTAPFDYGQMANAMDDGHSPSPPPEGEHDRSDAAPRPHSQSQSQSQSHKQRQSASVTVYQTTGPDAHTGPSLASDGSGTPVLNPRSCTTCRRRKVRCDKTMPCTNCRRALIPCVFPAPGRAPRQPRPRDPNAPPKNTTSREVELTKRLRKLEGIVEELSGQIEVDSVGKDNSLEASPDDGNYNFNNSEVAQPVRSSSLSTEASSREPKTAGSEPGPRDTSSKEARKKFGRLVQNGHKGGTRYVSSAFWSKLNDELDSIREDTQRLTGDEGSDESDYGDSPQETPFSGTGLAYDHHAFIFGYRSADVNLQKCHPLPAQVAYLWSMYQENVEPLLKIIHIPLADKLMRDARKNSSALGPSDEALVFAIYFGAVVSLEPEDVLATFGANKEDLVSRYRFACEQALSKANFINSSDLTTIQAFTIFLIIVRRDDDSRFCWALTGLVVRLAMGMGIHRDGTHLKLTPFETEMRRRTWWSIMTLDLRSAEELGTDTSIIERSFDTQFPGNYNDGDLCPEMTELPPPREGRSDMAVAIVRFEICQLSRRLLQAASAMGDVCPKVCTTQNVEEREQMCIDVYRSVEQRFLERVVDESDPLYWVAAMIARIIMSKMFLVIYQPMLYPGSEVELSDDIRQRIYLAGIEIIEYGHILNTDPRCKQYHWLFNTYTNWHAVAYVLLESCRRPWTALAERGWEALVSNSRTPLNSTKFNSQMGIFLPLRKLFVRAQRHRSSEIARLKANKDEARRIDFAERMNPAHARFGPVPGVENRMDEVREKWYKMVRPDGVTPVPFTTRFQTPLPTSSPAAAPNAQDPSVPSSGPGMDSTSMTTAPDAQPAASFQFSDATLDYMGDLIFKEPNFEMTSLWQLENAYSTDAYLRVKDASAGSLSSGTTPNPLPGSTAPSESAFPGATPNAAAGGAGDLPPYLWPGAAPFSHFPVQREDGSADDVDMIEEEFNWQDWSQSIRGMEMENNQPQRGW